MKTGEPIQPGPFLEFLKAEGVTEIYMERPAVQPAPPSGVSSPARVELLRLRETVLQCTACSELASTRKSVVFGAGNVAAKLMFIGEAPGHEEDIQGLPFVGAAGQLLTKIIEAIGLTRQQVFIANVLKCRPPQNRQPQPDEILNCEPYLKKQIELIRPRVIVALGTFAAQTLLKSGSSISQLRGKFFDFGDSRILCTYHPAYLLRNPQDKIKVWEDMKKVRAELGALEANENA